MEEFAVSFAESPALIGRSDGQLEWLGHRLASRENQPARRAEHGHQHRATADESKASRTIISVIVSREGMFERDSIVCPFDGHSPSNSTGGACLRSVPSRPAQYVRVVFLVTLRKWPNRSTRFERVVSTSPISPRRWDQIGGRCVDHPADHALRRRRLP
jgi:hypothetical protein